MEFEGRILRWGNSYAVRLRKADVERAGLREGTQAHVTIEPVPQRVDVSSVPTFRSRPGRGTLADDAAWGHWLTYEVKMAAAQAWDQARHEPGAGDTRP